MSRDFVYHNVNPTKTETLDCVCRAISLAVNLDYKAVEKLLEISAYYYGCDPLCVSCYDNLLEDVFNFPVRYCENGETVGQIAYKYPNNILIIRIPNHLTTSIYSIINDIWRCNDEIVDRYWIVR